MLHIIYDKKRSVKLAESEAELTGKQLIAVAKVLHGNLPPIKARLAMLHALTGKGIISFYRMPAEFKLKALEYTHWAFEDWTISEQLLPKYKGFYGPESGLGNINLAEFYFTEQAYADHLENDLSALDKLVATLYRPAKADYDIKKNKDGDIREEFNSNITQYNIRKQRRWPKAVKQAILLWYDGCRRKIAGDNAEIFSGGDASADNKDDMFGIIRGIAADGKYGDFEKVEKMYLQTALLEMSFILSEQKKMEAEIEAAKHKR